MTPRRARHQWTEEPHFPLVPLPVDVADAEAFPNIAAALEHARKLREARHG